MKLSVAVVLALASCTLAEPAAPRIFGGSGAAVGQYPFMAGIQQLFDDVWWEYTCGGTLLTRVIVVSAGRYFRSQTAPRFWRVRLGSNRASSGGTVHTVSQIVPHPELSNFNNDLAIVRLAVPAVYSSAIGPARIAGTNYNLPDGTRVHAAGFGHTMFRANSEVLLRVDMPIVNQQVCANRYAALSGYPSITNRMICSGGGNVGTCGADAGGPVIHGSDILVGVISFSHGCGDAPSVHSRVSYYSSWIASFQ